jgi:protein CLEC16A
MSIWISFVNGLSLKLNANAVQFFFNNNKQTFPLFTEAVRHFKHSESMVRIAVRTVTLKHNFVVESYYREAL